MKWPKELHCDWTRTLRKIMIVLLNDQVWYHYNHNFLGVEWAGKIENALWKFSSRARQSASWKNWLKLSRAAKVLARDKTSCFFKQVEMSWTIFKTFVFQVLSTNLKSVGTNNSFSVKTAKISWNLFNFCGLFLLAEPGFWLEPNQIIKKLTQLTQKELYRGLVYP